MLFRLKSYNTDTSFLQRTELSIKRYCAILNLQQHSHSEKESALSLAEVTLQDVVHSVCVYSLFCAQLAVIYDHIETIGELQVDILDVYSGILSDNKACYHRSTGFTALLEITKHNICYWRAQVSYNRHCLFNKTQSSNPGMDGYVNYVFIYFHPLFYKAFAQQLNIVY